MNDEEILEELMNKREVVTYVRFPSDVSDDRIYEVSETLYDFCDMLGANIKDSFWEVSDDFRRQPKLLRAIDSALKTKFKEIISVDLSTISSDRTKSLEIVAGFMDEGGFVYFTDEESVLMECQMIEEHEEDENEWN